MALSGALSRKMIKGKKGKKKPSVIVAHAQGVCSCEKWTAKEIDARTVELLEHALEYWSV